MSRSVDVLIAGGGIIGMSAAFQIARRSTARRDYRSTTSPSVSAKGDGKRWSVSRAIASMSAADGVRPDRRSAGIMAKDLGAVVTPGNLAHFGTAP